MSFFVPAFFHDDKITKISGKMNKKHKIVDSIKLKVNAQMEDVTIKVENDIREIAAMEVSIIIFFHNLLLCFNEMI